MQKSLLLVLSCCCACWILGQPNIDRVEYFFDNDPGFGKATTVSITPGSNLSDNAFSANLAPLSTGFHLMFIRSRDANGKWSITNMAPFAKLAIAPGLPNIDRVEYFYDNDPGMGNGIVIPITPGTNMSDVAVPLDLQSLVPGFHFLYVRSRDTNGKWSITNMTPFVKASLANQPAVEAEYFIDTDPGPGNAIPIAINGTILSGDLPVQVNVTGLAAGDHFFYLRTRNANGLWSITNNSKFTIQSLAATPFINVNALTKKTMCGDTEFLLSFHATGTYNPGNTFAVQLSDAAGSFANPLVIGSVGATQSSIVPCTIPLDIANGNNYKVRVVSSNPVVNGIAADTLFNLLTQPRFADSTVIIVCANETVNLTTLFNTTGFSTMWSTGNPGEAPAGNYTLVSSNTALCKDTAEVIVKQDVAIWLGTSSNNWYAGANWSTGRVPGEKTHVIIPEGTPNNCIINGGVANAASLQLATNANFNAINSGVLVITANCNPLPPG